MNFNNKILVLVFLGLLGLLALKKCMSKPELRSIREVLVEIDTSLVDKMVLVNKGASPIELLKNDNSWTANQNGIQVDATYQSIQGILTSIVRINPLNLVAKSKEKWLDYEVDDNTGKKLEIYSNGKLLDAFVAGRFNFNQNTRSAKTYMRKADEDDVYAVDGFLSMTYERELNDFRDKKLFIGLKKEDIAGINIASDALNNSLLQMENQWVNADGLALDSAKVATYLSSIPNRQSSELDLDFSSLNSEVLASLQFVDAANSEKALLKIYRDMGDRPFVYHSSLNPDVYFRSDSTGLFKGLWLDLVDLF